MFRPVMPQSYTDIEPHLKQLPPEEAYLPKESMWILDLTYANKPRIPDFRFKLKRDIVGSAETILARTTGKLYVGERDQDKTVASLYISPGMHIGIDVAAESTIYDERGKLIMPTSYSIAAMGLYMVATGIQPTRTLTS